MEFKLLGFANNIEKLRCAACTNYLSYFPIRVCSNNKNICGRCIAPEEDLVFQNVAFETLSQFMNFPCCYDNEGCNEILIPKDVPSHEKKCKFRVVACPTLKQSGCTWRGSCAEVLHHCQTQHVDEFMTNGEIKIDLRSAEEHSDYIEHDNLLLVFKSKLNVDRKILNFELYTSEFEVETKKFSCQLEAKCGNKRLSVDFNSTDFDEVILSELKLESISDNTTVTLKLTIGDIIEDPNRVINVEMLSVLKCFLCKKYAFPPIYHCVNNSDTLCSECKLTHQSSCNSCNSQNTGSTRNINLDKMANLLNYPCKNEENGCTYIGKPDNMKKHQISCELSDFSCPISEFDTCNWKGIWKNMAEHIQNNHQELVSNSAQLSKQLIPERMKCDIVKFSNQLFRLVCMKTPEEKYLWTVQVIGPHKENFKYEIEILDPCNKGRRLLVRQECGELTKKEQIFKNGDSYCYFLKDQIRDFVVDQVVTFKVYVFV